MNLFCITLALVKHPVYRTCSKLYRLAHEVLVFIVYVSMWAVKTLTSLHQHAISQASLLLAHRQSADVDKGSSQNVDL